MSEEIQKINVDSFKERMESKHISLAHVAGDTWMLLCKEYDRGTGKEIDPQTAIIRPGQVQLLIDQKVKQIEQINEQVKLIQDTIANLQDIMNYIKPEVKDAPTDIDTDMPARV